MHNIMRKRCILESLYIQDYNHTNIFNDNIKSVPLYIFSRLTSFLQKSSCRVSSEKNILNSSVKWSRAEWKNWIKVISLLTFSHIFCLLSILSYETRMIIDIHTCVIRKSQSLTYCFCLSISIRSHEARMIYARAFYGNF